jgi:hypothetical protein
MLDGAAPPAGGVLLDLGGRLLKAADVPAVPSGFRVYADPAGHPFCLCWLRSQPDDRI